MKRMLLCVIAAALLLFLSACSKDEPVDIFANADPDYCLYFSWFDGKEGLSGAFYAERYEIVEELKKVKATLAPDFTPDKMTYPVYALDPTEKNGGSLPFLWTNGYIITGDGTAYHFKYDFSKLQKKGFSYGYTREILSVSELPNGFRLVQSNGIWEKTCLTKAQDEASTEGILLQVTARNDEKLSLKLENATSKTWTYGEPYTLQVLLDGDWYSVPIMTSDLYDFTLVAYILEPGQSKDLSCSLTPYGKLPAGQYRIRKEVSLDDPYAGSKDYAVFAEFTVD